MENIELYKSLDRPDSGYFECQLQVITQTEKAVCFDSYHGYLDKTKESWVPKSQMVIIDFGKDDGGVRYFVKNWLYKKLFN